MNINASNASSPQQTSRMESFPKPVSGGMGKQRAAADQVSFSSLTDSIRTSGARATDGNGRAAEIGQLVSSGRYSIDSNTLSASVIEHSMAASA